MTQQSRQGDEPQLPAVRPAHEGVVLPADGSGPLPGPGRPAPPGAQPWGQPWGPQGHGAQPGQGPATFGQPLPPENGGRDADATQYIAPVPGGHGGPEGYGGNGGNGAHGGLGTSGSEATQYLAPVPPGSGDSEATQYIAPVPGGTGTFGGEATQYLAPVPGAPGNPGIPGAPGTSGSEATQYLAPVPGAMPPEGAGHQGFPGAQGHAQGSGADPTQFLPPVPPAPQDAPYGIRPGAPGDRQPPAEFDSLFRANGANGAPQQATEGAQLPRFQPSVPLNRQQPAPYPAAGTQGGQFQPQFAAQPPHQDPPGQQSAYEPEPRRRRSPVALIAAVVVGCAAIGLGAGALLSGGDDGASKDDKQPAGVSSPVAKGSGDAKDDAADPAKAQAQALDKVLADSGSSRDAVIGAVAEIRACDKLDQASTSLRSAAKQRGDLVTRLGALSLDKLPNHDRLSAALTKAWQSSASADNHYAAWSDAVAADKGKNCKDGHAKRTKDAGQGDKASGEATKSKQEASGLWNAIAAKYQLTKRGATQL
ncbi:hypothetical protein [Streptomyces sp. NBC_00083]|uniref:hypothetical protein n=1 Tax=Streptomyces sp. NBC_00083 TaxID=2975647 RepID=UPI002259220F|nr:hypothetical protein [Streptomyces sp. NBC_00083]MCX5381797.1 hypothetical protein [Streptomyces sp. NBC_00083]